ncbi:conserved hypothetical protein [Burkholderia sp. 8Y]|uniref:hypothetical protein n=1 Tax=Burkholderia sp. 8Y TaxID=2653133 RepID=UPI0012F3C8E7|nr:hypothetical protein [Burkholderia sp. 8Y]VXB52664.1 conserved hypothetical protein [Burkholderia sp. 8Y]
MPNVFVEPLPKHRDGAIEGYALELSATQRLTSDNYETQTKAIEAAKVRGYKPLVARVRKTDKGNPDHWRPAE